MNIKKTIGVLGLLLLVSGCSGTGGLFGGLIPMPKFTKGAIENDVYVSKEKDFSIAIPHKDGTYEFTYMEIKEEYNEFGAYISFGPAAYDHSIYRIEVGKKASTGNDEVSLEKAAELVIANYSKQLESAYKTKLKLISRDGVLINGQKSVHVKLTQPVQKDLLTHDVIITDHGAMMTIVWVQIFEHESTRALVDALYLAESFKVLK